MTENMPNKAPAIISVILTIIILIIFGVLSAFIELVALNGYSEREGGPALVVFGICQVAGLILSAVLAGWLTKVLAAKFNWNKILIVIVSVLAGTILGGVLGIPSFLISVMVAEGIR